MVTPDWLSEASVERINAITNALAGASTTQLADRISQLVTDNLRIHDKEHFNLNPASNVMNPKAEALLSQGLGSRASLGHPGEKYETGLQAIEEIEVIATNLACRVFDADYAELRVPSGAIANLYAFMALSQAGDRIIAPPASIGGHVTHHKSGVAGLYGLETVAAPVNRETYSVDVDALATLAKEVRPQIITIGGSLNLLEHPVRQIREIADSVGAYVLFDAAHQCGLIAAGTWSNPLDEGAHIMTMSTYKSLGGPPSGLLVTRDKELAEKIDSIAFPGMTANYDPSKTAAMAITLIDWLDHGAAYGAAMVEVSIGLADALQSLGAPVFTIGSGTTTSHQFALEAAHYGGGHTAALALEKAGFLACGIGLPIESVAGGMNGLRLGTPEIVRRGVGVQDTERMATLINLALTSEDPQSLKPEVSEWRRQFQNVLFVNR